MAHVIRQVALVLLGILIACTSMSTVLMVENTRYTQSIGANDRAKLTKLIKKLNR